MYVRAPFFNSYVSIDPHFGSLCSLLGDAIFPSEEICTDREKSIVSKGVSAGVCLFRTARVMPHRDSSIFLLSVEAQISGTPGGMVG